jgi:hypothetical protein
MSAESTNQSVSRNDIVDRLYMQGIGNRRDKTVGAMCKDMRVALRVNLMRELNVDEEKAAELSRNKVVRD